MEIKKNNILKLKDSVREYCVIDKIEYKQDIYLVLTAAEEPVEIRICKELKKDKKSILEDVKDEKLIKQILKNVKIEDE